MWLFAYRSGVIISIEDLKTGKPMKFLSLGLQHTPIFVRTRRFLLTSDLTDISCLVNLNFYPKKLSIVSNVKKTRIQNRQLPLSLISNILNKIPNSFIALLWTYHFSSCLHMPWICLRLTINCIHTFQWKHWVKKFFAYDTRALCMVFFCFMQTFLQKAILPDLYLL